MERLADLLLRHPKAWTAGLALLLVLAAAYLGAVGIRFDNNLENFLPAGDPLIQEYRAFVEDYEPDDDFIAVAFTVEDAFAYPTLRDLALLTDTLAAMDGVRDVVSLTTAEGLRGTATGIDVSPLVGRVVDDPARLAEQRRAVLADSFAVGYVVNPEGTAVALFVQLEEGANTFDQRDRVIREVEARMAAFPYEAHYSGFPYLRNNYVNKLRVETVKYVALSSVLILLVLGGLFRNWVGTLVPLSVVLLACMATVAIMMVTGAAIDVMTSTIFSIILVVGVADAMHLLAKYYAGLGRGLDKRAAVRETLVKLGAATFLTSATTAVGFITLSTSPIVPMQRFGVFTAVGVLVAFAVSIVLLGAILLWARTPTQEQVERIGRGSFDRLFLWVDRVAEHRRWAIVAMGALLLVLGGVGATGLRLNTFVNDDLGPNSEAYQHMTFFQDNIVSPFSLELLLQASEPEAFKEPERLRQVDRVADYLRAQPEVTRVVSGVDLLEGLNRALHADSAQYARVPASRELAAQYLFLLELTDEELLRRFLDYDLQEARLAIMMDDVGSARMKGFRADLDSVLAAEAPDLQATQTGTIVLAANLADYLVESLLWSIGLAFVFVSGLMGVLFRNAKLVLIALVPNVLPLVVIAGVMGIVGIDIKPATAVIFSIAFGIAVDDTIHVLARLRQEIAAGLPLREALRETLLGTGRAVVLTSIVLLGGFGVLMTSEFQSVVYLGGLVSLTVGLALFADLFLLPALLHILQPDLRPPPTASAVDAAPMALAASPSAQVG